MSLLSVELPLGADLHDGDEVVIRGRISGQRLIAASVAAASPGETAEVHHRTAAIDEFLRVWCSDASRDWSDQEIDRALSGHFQEKHLK